jgi:hypothetical protein
MRQGLEHVRYVQEADGQWYVETLTGFDQDHEPLYQRNPMPLVVDLQGESKLVPVGRDAEGKPVMGVHWVRWPTHQVDHEGRLHPFRHPGQGSKQQSRIVGIHRVGGK